MIRTQKIPFLQSRASFPLILTTGVIMALGIFIPYSFIGQAIGLISLPPSYFFYLTVLILGYCFLTQTVKGWFVRQFQYWL